jgi:hypothetical protein
MILGYHAHERGLGRNVDGTARVPVDGALAREVNQHVVFGPWRIHSIHVSSVIILDYPQQAA